MNTMKIVFFFIERAHQKVEKTTDETDEKPALKILHTLPATSTT